LCSIATLALLIQRFLLLTLSVFLIANRLFISIVSIEVTPPTPSPSLSHCLFIHVFDFSPLLPLFAEFAFTLIKDIQRGLICNRKRDENEIKIAA
jgi:hypothetical protein